MTTLTQETFNAIKDFVIKLCDKHEKAYNKAWHRNEDKMIGRAIILDDSINGPLDRFDAYYFYNPIKGTTRPDVRRELAEINFYYHFLPPVSTKMWAKPMDIYKIFTDKVITHRIQESSPHKTESGSLSYQKNQEDLNEEEARKLLKTLNEIFEDQNKKGLINN